MTYVSLCVIFPWEWISFHYSQLLVNWVFYSKIVVFVIKFNSRLISLLVKGLWRRFIPRLAIALLVAGQGFTIVWFINTKVAYRIVGRRLRSIFHLLIFIIRISFIFSKIIQNPKTNLLFVFLSNSVFFSFISSYSALNSKIFRIRLYATIGELVFNLVRIPSG